MHCNLWEFILSFHWPLLNIAPCTQGTAGPEELRHRHITPRHSHGKERCWGRCSNHPSPSGEVYYAYCFFFLLHYTPPLLLLVMPIFCFYYWFHIIFGIVSCSNLSVGLLICCGGKIWTGFRQPLQHEQNIVQMQLSTKHQKISWILHKDHDATACSREIRYPSKKFPLALISSKGFLRLTLGLRLELGFG